MVGWVLGIGQDGLVWRQFSCLSGLECVLQAALCAIPSAGAGFPAPLLAV